ncbi:endonuclease-reverse transcriptase [Plakobranchus ocellatus]|uniref:Endonuclease-reverse transcriptase n=1 Tax=Plakobranchus ocellatus TaxID=259542 RepID=A0AAV3ZQG7_9GAST|nr:endonuclease-reverse transcriptase [Plakobranchus ocellatus]
MIKRRFQSSENIAQTRSFPGAGVCSDHELVIMTFALRLKKNKKRGNIRIKFDIDKLKDPNILTTFQANIGGRFAPLLVLDNDQDLTPNDLVETFNETLSKEASKLLGKPRVKKKKWMADEIPALCDKRRSLKKRNKDPEGGTKQARATTIESKEGKCLTEKKEILERWTEYCSELYTHVATKKDPNVLNMPPSSNNARHSILRAELIEAVSSLKPGKSTGIDNITRELVQAGGDATIDMLLLICNKILQTVVWQKPWTQSLVITLPKKGNLKLFQNYRTISLISHPSKVMLQVILNRLKHEAEKIIVEEQAGFRPGRSTIEQMCNVRILMEKYLQHQQELHHVFIDFKKAFDRVYMRSSGQP